MVRPFLADPGWVLSAKSFVSSVFSMFPGIPPPPLFLKYVESVGSGFFRGKRLRRQELDPVRMGLESAAPFHLSLGNHGA
jgi:hypothetical protein